MKLPSVFDNWSGYTPPEPQIQLRDYQQDAIDSVWEYMRSTPTGNPLIAAPTGSGKSMILAGIIHDAWKKAPGTRIMMLTHVKELIAQNEIALKRYWPDAPVGVFSAGMRRKEADAPILFGGVQSVCRAVDKIGHADFVIVDECLEEGSMVSGTPIEDIRPGDMVDSFDHSTGSVVSREVVATRASRTSRPVVSCETECGRKLLSTDNHPVWTKQDGYKKAECLVVGDIVRVLQVQQGIPAFEESDKNLEEGESTVLLEGLQIPDTVQGKVSSDDGGQSNGPAGGKGEGVCDPEIDRSQAPTGRERSRTNCPSEAPTRHAGTGLGDGKGDQDREQKGRGRDLVFSGPSAQGFDDDSGGGRWLTQRDQGEGEGQEARRETILVRLAHVEIQKQGDSQRTVYNLQIDQTENFFANGILTHNCHLIPKKGEGQYLSAFKALRSIRPRMRVIGLTATPFRTDSGYLHKGKGRLFDELVYDIPLLDLMNSGFISRVTSKNPRSHINTSAVSKARGDFNAKELEAAAMDGDNVSEAVTEVIERGGDRRGWMFFASGKAHAEMIRDEVRSRGISCDMVMGDTPSEERKTLIQNYKDQKIRAIVSVGVLTTGFDAPHVDLIALMRPTMSPGLHVQIVGRGLRLCDGKANCLAAGTLVKTDQGLVPIEKITTDMLVWDGDDFVSHDGAVSSGVQSVVVYDGLTATPDHRVMTRNGWKTFGWCKDHGEKIVRDPAGGREVWESHNRSGGMSKKGEAVFRDGVQWVRCAVGEGDDIHKQGDGRVSSVRETEVSPEVAGIEVLCCKGPVLEPEEQKVPGLWREGYRVQVPVSHIDGRLAAFGDECGEVATDRQNRQRWELRAGKYSDGDSLSKPDEQEVSEYSQHAQVSNREPRGDLRRQHTTGDVLARDDRRGYSGTVQQKVLQAKGEVWDILNAGPKHRFVAAGLIVSNCLVLDFAGNIERHGPLDSIKVSEPGEGQGEAPIKECPMCQELVAAGVLLCPSCGHEFPPREIVKHQSKASYLAVISDDDGPSERPMIEVNKLLVDRHCKQGKADSVKITYVAGMAVRFSEWVFFDRGLFMSRKADAIWKQLGGEKPYPKDTDDALERADELRCPSHVQVVQEGRFDRVVGRLFIEREPGADDSLEEDVAVKPSGEFQMDLGDIPF